jgi:hypothetical protein
MHWQSIGGKVMEYRGDLRVDFVIGAESRELSHLAISFEFAHSRESSRFE